MAAASRTSQANVSTGVESEDLSFSSASPRRATRPSVAPRAAYNRASASPMPLEAPVRNTFIASALPLRRRGRGGHLLARGRDELVDHEEDPVAAARLLRRR